HSPMSLPTIGAMAVQDISEVAANLIRHSPAQTTSFMNHNSKSSVRSKRLCTAWTGATSTNPALNRTDTDRTSPSWVRPNSPRHPPSEANLHPAFRALVITPRCAPLAQYPPSAIASGDLISHAAATRPFSVITPNTKCVPDVHPSRDHSN